VGLEQTTATCACSSRLQTRARGEISFNIDGGHMYQFDRTLYNWAVTYPAETGACGQQPQQQQKQQWRQQQQQ
jgi:hypothetical protein